MFIKKTVICFAWNPLYMSSSLYAKTFLSFVSSCHGSDWIHRSTKIPKVLFRACAAMKRKRG